jgi:Fur family zinc uptake transcriptional regulator
MSDRLPGILCSNFSCQLFIEVENPLKQPTFPAVGHDHHRCIEDALRDAEHYCRNQGLRLTELRRRVLELVWESHQPVRAYALLERLAAEGRKGAPPTIYRSLEFLLEHRLIHRIASLNAFVGCSHPGRIHAAHFFICHDCGEAAELADRSISDSITAAASRLEFMVGESTLEVTGRCARCANGGQR